MSCTSPYWLRVWIVIPLAAAAFAAIYAGSYFTTTEYASSSTNHLRAHVDAPSDVFKLAGTSGKVRSIPNLPSRQFTGRTYFQDDNIQPQDTASKPNNANWKCLQPIVAVVTTIFPASEAILQLAQSHPDMPIVVVGDRKGPQNIEEFMQTARHNITAPDKSRSVQRPGFRNIFFYSASEQESYASASRTLGEFARLMPWYHFGRKNIGYLIAIKHFSACAIWDFDDDNILKQGVHLLDKMATLGRQSTTAGGKAVLLGLQDSCKTDRHQTTTGKNEKPQQNNTEYHDYHVTNPYTALSPTRFIWPRGFPIERVAEERTGRACITGELVLIEAQQAQVAVYQAAADGDPDVDAIFRMTEDTSVYFHSQVDSITLASGVYSPYNAQATLHMPLAFFALYLPISVHGRVSDIWRSYISQTLFGFAGVHVAFTEPLVSHQRTKHDYKGDFVAEQDLYDLAGPLLKYLHGWSASMRTECSVSTCTIPRLAEGLFMDLYERALLSQADVVAMQSWLRVLQEIAFPFPSVNLSHFGSVHRLPRKRSSVSTTVYFLPTEAGSLPLWHMAFSSRFGGVHYAVQRNDANQRHHIFPHLTEDVPSGTGGSATLLEGVRSLLLQTEPGLLMSVASILHPVDALVHKPHCVATATLSRSSHAGTTEAIVGCTHGGQGPLLTTDSLIVLKTSGCGVVPEDNTRLKDSLTSQRLNDTTTVGTYLACRMPSKMRVELSTAHVHAFVRNSSSEAIVLGGLSFVGRDAVAEVVAARDMMWN